MKRQHKKNEKEQNIELFKLHFDINLSIRENKKNDASLILMWEAIE